MWHRQRVMKIRYAPALALLLIAAACGDDPDASGPPVFIVAAGGNAAPSASGDMAAGVSESKMMPIWSRKLVAGVDLPALDSSARAYSMSPGTVSVDDVATLGAALGVDGDVTTLSVEQGGGYHMGADDGSTSSLWVSGDPTGYWSYSPSWSASTSVACPPVASDASDDGSVSSVGCAAPEPPTNVPSADEARDAFTELVGSWGIDTGNLVIETWADAWGANVYGYLKIDGVRSPLTVSVSFGSDAAITYASGFLGEVVEGAEYPRIGTTAALERLNLQQYVYPMMRGGIAVGAQVAVAAGVESATVTADTVVPTAETLPVAVEPTGDITVDTMVAPPVDTTPVEVEEVRVVGVEEELMMLYGADGSVYLVPAYTFLGEADDTGYQARYTVSALPDEYVQQADPVAIEPAVVDPLVDPMDPGSDVTISDAAAAELVGLSESGAIEAAKANGWESRVVSRDGVDLAVTMDYRMDRVNLTIVDDVVTASKVG